MSTATDNFGKVASFQAHGGIGPYVYEPDNQHRVDIDHSLIPGTYPTGYHIEIRIAGGGAGGCHPDSC